MYTLCIIQLSLIYDTLVLRVVIGPTDARVFSAPPNFKGKIPGNEIVNLVSNYEFLEEEESNRFFSGFYSPLSRNTQNAFSLCIKFCRDCFVSACISVFLKELNNDLLGYSRIFFSGSGRLCTK